MPVLPHNLSVRLPAFPDHYRHKAERKAHRSKEYRNGRRLQRRSCRGCVPALTAVRIAYCAQLSLSSTTAPPAASLLRPMAYVSQSASAAGIQFDLQYDNSAWSLSATVGVAVRTSGNLGNPAPGQERFLIVWLNRDPIDGPIINVFANLSPKAPSGTYPP